jgi:hypothetical protein
MGRVRCQRSTVPASTANQTSSPLGPHSGECVGVLHGSSYLHSYNGWQPAGFRLECSRMAVLWLRLGSAPSVAETVEIYKSAHHLTSIASTCSLHSKFGNLNGGERRTPLPGSMTSGTVLSAQPRADLKAAGSKVLTFCLIRCT